MKNILGRTTIFIFSSVLASKVALAYIDPGTGSAIAGSIWPLIVALFSAVFAFTVKFFWNPIKNTTLKIFSKRDKKE